MVTKTPRRKRKGDRLINPDARNAQIACDHALAPFDREARAMEIKWGIDRLPTLVTPEMAARYGSAVAHLNDCINNEDPEQCAQAANNCIRGLHAMDAAATQAGHQPASGEFWEYRLEDRHTEPPFHFAIMKDGDEWQTAKAKRPELRFFTMREVALALRAYTATLPTEKVKALFPNMQIADIRPKVENELPPINDDLGGDEIPF